MKDGRVEFDNNRAERSIKPFVIGRKNWLFAASTSGANSSAISCSLVETAKENGLNPFFYLKYLFEELPQLDMSANLEIDHLSPGPRIFRLLVISNPRKRNNVFII